MSPILDILTQSSSAELAKAIVKSYEDMQKNYLLKKPKYTGLDAGHYVESIRRFIEFKLSGSYTPLSEKLPPFSDPEVQRIASKGGPDNYRLIIPRVLFSIYTIRNKRGMGHISGIDPTNIDASFVYQSCKWILAEIVRTESGLPENECLLLLDKIVSRTVPLIWKTSDFRVITDPSLVVKDKVLILLLDENPLELKEISEATRCTNITRLKRYLSDLKKDGHIHYFNEKYYLSPAGEAAAEEILISRGILNWA